MTVDPAGQAKRHGLRCESISVPACNHMVSCRRKALYPRRTIVVRICSCIPTSSTIERDSADGSKQTTGYVLYVRYRYEGHTRHICEGRHYFLSQPSQRPERARHLLSADFADRYNFDLNRIRSNASRKFGGY